MNENEIIKNQEFVKIKTGLENIKSVLRGYYSGVFYGVILEIKVFGGIQIFKIKGRRLYRWKAIKGISINALAEYGIHINGDIKIENETTFYCYDINQILPCTKDSIKLFDSVKKDFNY